MTSTLALSAPLAHVESTLDLTVRTPAWMEPVRAAAPPPARAEGRLTRAAPPAGKAWQETKWTLVRRAGGAVTPESAEALRGICDDYYEPLLAFARHVEADPERARDLVHGFLAALLSGKIVGNVDQAKGRFRSYLRTAFRHHVSNERKREGRIQRGGKAEHSGDTDSVPSDALLADQIYDRAWACAVLDRVFAELSSEHESPRRKAQFKVLWSRLQDGPESEIPLSVVAPTLGMSEGALKVAAHRFRKRYGEILRALLAETTDDVEAEIAELMAALRTSP
ncbi:MAG: hypothetical protein U0441_01610 [Polyangiaceae bacterium]